ncbi:MAG: 4-phosphopantetheinyl transferase family protein, partial [Firmicutes bacterium]|nr:4-phosphopantetheinyl transferase family protein [Bacillota bacterium]
KEAYVKYLGTGIGEGMNSFSVININDAEEWDQRSGFQTVDLVEELELVVYSPQDEVEEIRWRKW